MLELVMPVAECPRLPFRLHRHAIQRCQSEFGDRAAPQQERNGTRHYPTRPPVSYHQPWHESLRGVGGRLVVLGNGLRDAHELAARQPGEDHLRVACAVHAPRLNDIAHDRRIVRNLLRVHRRRFRRRWGGIAVNMVVLHDDGCRLLGGACETHSHDVRNAFMRCDGLPTRQELLELLLVLVPRARGRAPRVLSRGRGGRVWLHDCRER
mmetsp:Transcript_97397/g.275385  ORF Transcript_97397/g.275385 Transcript_97397/m.275385 type:complete len:209 (+) Transcript_97397:863-1489(+)